MFDNIWEAHYSSPWQNNFINGIQIHDQSLWFKLIAIYLSKTQFSLAILKLNSHWQHQNSILIGNIKAQFSLAISKPSSRWQYLKPNSHWQYQNPILIGNIKSPIYIDNIKSPILIGNIKNPIYIGTIKNSN